MYIDQNGFTNIVFEICERVGPSGNSAEIDGAALAVHLQELAGDDDETRMWNVVDTKFSELPCVDDYFCFTYHQLVFTYHQLVFFSILAS